MRPDIHGAPTAFDSRLTVANTPRHEPTYVEIVGEFFRAIGVDIELSTYTEAEGGRCLGARKRTSLT